VSPLAAFQAGAVLDVPIIMGNVANESNLFINFAFNKSVDDTEYYVLLGVIIGLDHMEAIIEQYPIPSPAPTDYRAQLSTVGSDALFVCPNRNTSASVSAAPGRKSPIFLYFYDHIESFNPAVWGPVYPFDDCWPIVCHGADLVELFHPNYPQYGTNYTTAENALTLTIQSYWTNFASTGNPGSGAAGNGVRWPAYNVTDRSVMILQSGGNVVARDNRGELCNFWDSIVGYNFY
jgi:para-nitrobenzyl esterase